MFGKGNRAENLCKHVPEWKPFFYGFCKVCREWKRRCLRVQNCTTLERTNKINSLILSSERLVIELVNLFVATIFK